MKRNAMIKKRRAMDAPATLKKNRFMIFSVDCRFLVIGKLPHM
jgi:hypothetical protein